MMCYSALRKTRTTLPQRGDPRMYALVQGLWGRYANPAYVDIGDEVYCGILVLDANGGCSFAHPHWGQLQKAQPTAMYSEEAKSYALHACYCIQTDLRYKLGQASHSVKIAGRTCTDDAL